MSSSKAQEAGLEDDDDNISVASVRRASPTPSVATTALGREEPLDEPPAYSAIASTSPEPSSWTNADPRSTSTESLVNAAHQQDGRRRMLLVYVHGFMGNETSFQSFPAHVHNLISVLLSESHVVHTKVYPRYRTKNALQSHAQRLSEWLAPNQDPNTDVVLLGHSLGGLLAADTALLRDARGEQIRHKLLGTISFDSPFLGMHPGVVWSGISSLFRPAPTPPKSPQLGAVVHPDTFTQTSSLDPYFNPRFANDVHLPIRTGWANTLHFVNKHSKHLHHATKNLVTSHFQFGSELADGKALKRRYHMIKSLDSDNDTERGQTVDGRSHPKRTRFVNYYTACSGRPKRAPDPSQNQQSLAGGAPSPGLLPPSSDTFSLRTGSVPSRDGASPTPSMSSHTAVDLGTPSVHVTSRDGEDRFDMAATEGRSRSQDSPLPSASQDFRALSASSSLLRSQSPAPSFATLPSYTTEPPTLAAAPGYPLSAQSSGSTTLSGTSPHQTISPTASMSTISPAESLQPPTPIGPPPLPSDYPRNPAAYGNAIKEYLQASKTYAHALRDYRRNQTKQCQAEWQAKLEQKKASFLGMKDDRRLELQTREEERRRIEGAPTEELRQREIEAMRQRHKREDEWKKERLNSEVQEFKEEHKLQRDAAKAERKAARTLVKEERKATRDAIKERHKMTRDERKTSRKSHPCSSKPGCPSQVLWDSNDTTIEPESYDDTVEMQPVSSTSTLPSSTLDKETSRASASTPREAGEGKKIKDKKFCMLPKKDAYGHRDPSWQRVFLQDVDEVGAHCGLFFPQGATGAEAVEGQAWGERYAWLVADVAERIETWAHDEMTERLVSGVEAL